MPLPDRDYNLEEVLKAFRRDGSLIREKARVLTEEGLEELYRRMVDHDLSTAAFLDVLKYLADIGDLKPKQSTTPIQGPGFSITINIPQPEGKPPITIDAQATDVSTQDDEGVMGEVPLSEVPMKLLGKLGVNSDLKGGSGASGI